MAEVTVGAPVDFDPFAKNSRSFVDSQVSPVSPDVQAQRDKIALNLRAKEAAGTGDLPTDAVVAGAPTATPQQIAEFSGQVSTPNRGAKIAAERRKPVFTEQTKPTVTVGPAVDYDPFAVESKVAPSDFTKSAAAGALSGAGMIAQGGGELLALGLNTVGDRLGFDQKIRAINPLQGWVNDLLDARTPAAKKAEANTQISGELLKPSTWSAGKDPSVAGLVLQGVNAIGQFAPNLGVALVTAGASVPTQLAIGATVGGLQGMGGGADEERTKFQHMNHAELLEASALYRELVGRGVPQNQAKDAVAEAAAIGGGLGNAIPSAGEGAFENFLIGALTRGKLKIPSLGAGFAGRTVSGAVGGAAMGGTEEALEQASQNLGSNVAVGGNRPLGADTLQQFVMGMIAEGVAGGGAGALSKSAKPATVPPAPADSAGQTPAQPATTPATFSPAPSQEGAVPAVAAPSASTPNAKPIEPDGLPLQFPGSPTYTRAPESLATQPIENPPPPLSPIDQARADAQVLKAGNPLDADGNRLKNATLVVVYGENAAVRHVVEGGQPFSAIGDAMLAAAPMVEKVRGTLKAGEQSRDITEDILGAVDELAKIKASGQDVAKVLAHGVPHDISYEGQQLLQFLHENADNSQRMADFLERYLHEVEMASGVPSQVRGRAFDIIEERNAARKADQEAKQSERKDAAFKSEEKRVKSDKLETTKLANEQHRAEIVLQTIARAKASGSGINSEHMTAMELAFANAQLKKEKKNEARGSIQSGSSGSAQGGSGPVQTGAGKGTVSKPAEAGHGRDTRQIRAGEPAKSAQRNENRGVAIAAERKGNGERNNPVQASTAKHIATAAARAEPLPSPAQIEADVARKGHFEFAEGNPLRAIGMVSIETAKGVKRVHKDGKWSSPELPHHYGHLQIAKGADGDKADITIGDNLKSENAYVIDQIDPATKKFDETKSFVAFSSKKDAVDSYLASFSDNAKTRIGAVTEMPIEQFIQLARSDNLDKPVAYKDPQAGQDATAAPSQEGHAAGPADDLQSATAAMKDAAVAIKEMAQAITGKQETLFSLALPPIKGKIANLSDAFFVQPNPDGGDTYNHIIYANNVPVGFVLLGWNEGKITALYNIRVKEEYRRKGIAPDIIEAILAHNGGTLDVRNIDAHARSFWKGIGTQFIGDANGQLTSEKFGDKRKDSGVDKDSGGTIGAGNKTPRGEEPKSRRTEKPATGSRNSDVERWVKPFLAKWKNAPEVVFIQSMEDSPEGVRLAYAQQNEGGATGIPAGFWSGGKVWLVGDGISNEREAIETLFHESLGHYGLRGAFGDALKPILGEVGIGRKADVDAKIKQYGFDPKSTSHRLVAAEEVLANLAQTHPDLGIVKRAIAAIRNWLRSHGIKLNWTNDDLVHAFILPARRFVEGGGKAGGEGPTTFSFSERTVEVDGVRRPITNADGKLVAQTVQAQIAFWKWFGDSKVVDERGRPVVVYHGTGSNFKTFNKKKSTQGIFWFTSDRASVEAGEVGAQGRGKIMELYARVEHPADWTQYDKLGLYEFKGRGLDGAMLSKDGGFDGFVFDSQQLKSATDNAGTFDATNPDIRFSLVPEWVSSQPADTQEALRKAGIWHQAPTLKERVKDWSKDWQQRARQGLVDQFDPIKNYDFKAYMLARMSKSSDAALEGVLMNGTVYLDKDGAVDVNYEKGGFLGILSKLQNEHDRFFAWVVGNRAERLLAEGKEHNFKAADIARLKVLNQGTMADNKSRPLLYEAALNGLRRYNKSVMDMAEKAGLIDADSRSVWEKDFYVPFYRVMETDRTKGPTIAKGLVRQYAFKTLKGGSDVIGDPLENVLKNWSHLIDASLKNQAAKESVLAAEKVGAAVEAPEETARQMAKTIGKKDAVIHFMDNGTPRYFIIDDPFLLDALQSIGFSGFQGVGMKAMQKFKHWLTLGVTISPTFRIRNIIRDSLTMIGTNPASYNVLNNIATGWKMAKEGDPYYASVIAGGGVMRYGTALEGDRAEHVKRLIEAGVEDNTILNTPEKVKAMLQQAWDWWAHIGDRSENVNRLALYKTLRDQGKSHLEASFAARDTMDFSMQGTWAAIRFLAQTVPFFNARLQGLYKLGRGAYADPQRFAYVVGGAAMASIALLLAYKDDDDWKRREDFDRESYWWFKVGDKAFRIPKPFEIGAIGTLAERAVEVMISDELTGKQFLERMGAIVTQQLSMNPIPQLVKPIIETWANKDFFTDRPIESMGMEKLSTSQRIGPNTSGVARVLGKAGLVSPVQIDHLISAYFGWLGTHIVMTADMAVKPAIGAPDKAAARVDEMFVVGDFIKDLPAHESRYITHLYDQAKRVQESMADYRQALETKDAVRAKEILQEQGDRIKLSRLYSSAASQLSEINRQIKAVQNGAESPETKRDRLEKLYVIRSAMAKATELRARDFQK